MSGLRIYSTEL